MQTSPEKAREILKTLPVSLYLKFGVPVILDEDHPQSFADLLHKEVHIAFAQIAKALAPVKDELADADEVERAIRCLQYHEIGHLMLTPAPPFGYPMGMSRRNNIMEDERLETLLRNTFHGVDFRRNINRIRGYDPKTYNPQDFGEFFMGVVRHRHGPPELEQLLDKVIDQSRHIAVDGNGYELERLYEAFEKACMAWWNQNGQRPYTPPPPPPPQQQQQQQQQRGQKSSSKNTGDGQAGENPPPPENGGQGSDPDSGEDKDGDRDDSSSPSSSEGDPKDTPREEEGEEEGDSGESGKDNEDGDSGEADGSDESESGEDKGDKSESESGEFDDSGSDTHGDAGEDGDKSESESESGDGGGGDETPSGDTDGEAGERKTDKPDGGGGGDGCSAPPLSDAEMSSAAQALKNVLNTYRDAVTAQKLDRIATRVANKRSFRSGVSRGYAGHFDPKAAVKRRDYRWWSKSGTSESGFDRLHLRLWVDVSGSFDGPDIDAVNKLVGELHDLEKRMPDKFCFSVIAQGSSVRVWDKDVPLYATEGTIFNETQAEVAIRQTAKPGWRTINVSVWDGPIAACPSKPTSTMEEMYRVTYAPLNNHETVIVADKRNEQALTIGAPLARRMFIGRNFAQRFISEVLRLLDAII